MVRMDCWHVANPFNANFVKSFEGLAPKSNQIVFIGLRSSNDYNKRPGGGVRIWEGSFGCELLRGSMCAEGMCCGRRWVR